MATQVKVAIGYVLGYLDSHEGADTFLLVPSSLIWLTNLLNTSK